MNEERPVWRIVLSVCITLFLLVRLAYKCSNTNNSNTTYQNNAIESLERNNAMESYNELQRNSSEAKSNQLLYMSYQQLDSLSDNEKKQFGLSKLSKDSVVSLDVETKIKVDKDYFFQKNYDDSLKMGFKSPDELTLLIHDFESKQTIEENFKSLKRGMELSKLTYDQGTDKSKLFSYSIIKNGKKWHGYSMGFQQDDYFLFLEFESDKLSKDVLKMKALDYLLNNLKAGK